MEPFKSKGLCPVCGEKITITGRTEDGRLIGSCGDAFTVQKWVEEDCPDCGEPMEVMLFMGVQPDFYVCKKCQRAFHPETLKPLARVIGI